MLSLPNLQVDLQVKSSVRQPQPVSTDPVNQIISKFPSHPAIEPQFMPINFESSCSKNER